MKVPTEGTFDFTDSCELPELRPWELNSSPLEEKYVLTGHLLSIIFLLIPQLF